ncbi:MAG: hypothetical protein HOP13_19050 [Alphaproteobacteria bacterium]|nr:hypothetical protein [Alphaproteobacteria bacterium]
MAIRKFAMVAMATCVTAFGASAAGPVTVALGNAEPPMKCVPSVVGSGDTLRVTLPFPHGPYFTIVPPKADYFLFVTVPFNTQAELGETAIAGERFVPMRTIALKVSDAVAIPWVRDEPSTKVFQRPGKYVLRVGHHFETESPSIEGICTVVFRR